MSESITLTRSMMAANPFAIVKSAKPGIRLIAETVEVDDENNLWCWIDDEYETMLDQLNDKRVCLKYADKQSGRFMIVQGTMTTTNFLPPSVSHYYQKNTSGYLCKVCVHEFEYFEKKRINAHTNVLDSIRKYSLGLVERIAGNTLLRKKELLYGDTAA